jgi:hypothetical protein
MMLSVLHPGVTSLALIYSSQLNLFEQFLTQAVSGIDSTSITSGMQNVGYVILVVGFLWQVYQSALHGGDVRGLGAGLIKYVATAVVVMNYHAVFTTVNQGFVNAGNWISNASGGLNLLDNWRTDIQTQFSQIGFQNLWGLVTGSAAGLIDALLIIVAYLLYPLVIVIFGFFYILYPTFAAPRRKAADGPTEDTQEAIDASAQMSLPESALGASAEPKSEDTAQPGHIIVPENTKGWSYRRLFANHLKGARRITVNDPYVRVFFQARNVMEFLQVVHEIVPEGDEVAVELVTQQDRETPSRQEENLNQMVSAFAGSRVVFSWKFDSSPNFHARSIATDTGWKITIDRGLDIFQRFETGPFSLEQAIQEARLTRGAEVTYLRV